MAFSSFGNPGGAVMGGVAADVQNGPDLEDIQTEALGFLALAGEAKVQLLPSPWPADNLPPPTASLMSVASHKGLVAAAGPDAIIVATTESVRKAFEGGSSGTGEGNFKSFQPEMKLPMPTRISQLAFSADETYLVLSAEIGGGLAVYEVDALLRGSIEPAFQVPTNGQPLRALAPNPTPEKGELFAAVTANGNLMMANLKERSFVAGPNGQILKDGVSCISWSAKGKQLVAGLGNGTACQMTPEGVPKGEIPKPPGMDSNHHISSITWLENNVFLMVYTPSNADTGVTPASVFSIVTRQPPSSFQFQKISEPVGPFGLNRSPPHHFMLRLRDFPPNLQDLLIVASSASTDIGLFSRSKSPLANNKPVGTFTMTELSDDSRRAQLPMTADLSDTSPIGFALDLSSKEKVQKPIPSDEMDESLTALPSLMVLNNDGVLASWWIVYSDSVRQGTIYPNLVAAGGQSTVPPSSPAPAQPSTSPFSGPSTSFSAPSNSTPVPGFGTTTGIGQRTSPWGTASTPASTTINVPGFGKPAFASVTPSAPAFATPGFGSSTGPAFGTSGFSSNKTSPWGSATPSGPAFGQKTPFGKPPGGFASPAPSSGTTAPSAGGFASFASQGGFAAAAPAPTGSIFTAKPNTSIFAPTTSIPGTNTTGFGITETKVGDNPFGGSANKFVLSPAFKDTAAKDDTTAPSNAGKSPIFGSGFGNALRDVAKAASQETMVSKDADMDSTDEVTKPEDPAQPSSTTPTSTPAPSRSLFPTSGVSGSNNIFANAAPISFPSSTQPTGFGFGNTATQASKQSGFSFLNLNPPPVTTQPTQPLALSEKPPSPIIKEEPSSDTERRSPARRAPDAPLPPDATSKTSFSAGDSSSSSIGTDAPLPPDFISKVIAKPIPADLIPPSDVPGGPEDDGDGSDFLSDGDEEGEEGEESDEDHDGRSDDDGSGEDVAKDLSPTSELTQTPGFTPQSSYGLHNRGTDSGSFTKIEKPSHPTQPRGLYGEISPAHVLPPPLQSSPRSPSPVRNAIPRRMLRPETSRSVSAPGVASQILASQKVPAQSTFSISLEQQRADDERKANARALKEHAETQALVDAEDDRLQEFLSSDLEPTRTLDAFVGHVEISGPSSIDSIPAQVETVYRDINSMIDTLGINARALKSFIKGHAEQYQEGGRAKEDLEIEEDWCLVEIDDLSVVIEKNLTKELEDGRVKDVASKLETCNDLQKDLIRLHARHEDIKKVLASHADSNHLAIARAQPLSAEQAAQQHDLRRNFTKFQKLLSEAEEGLTVLKAKIVSQSTSDGKSSGSAGPTVEAVMRTITKMTSMAEKRSGDIDVLEGQMRKLRFSSTASIGSREGSPFTTPNNRASVRNPGTSSTYGLFYTPDSIKDDRRGFQNSLMSSTGSFGRSSPPRKKMSGYSAEEKIQLKTKLARQKEVTDRLRAALRKAGTKVRLMDHDE